MHHSAAGSSRDPDLVLVIDDDPELVRIVSFLLTDEGFRVATVGSGEDAAPTLEAMSPDLVLLDLEMPASDGVEILKLLRRISPVPVVCLTGRAAVAHRTQALDMGADDVIVKPFHGDELAARVRAVLRRSGARPARAGAVHFGDLEIDRDRRLLRKSGKVVWLGRTEWDLLQVLIRSPGTVVLSSDLLVRVWGPEYAHELEILRNCISRLRRKLRTHASDDDPIRTYVGVGYSLEPPREQPLQRDVDATRVPVGVTPGALPA